MTKTKWIPNVGKEKSNEPTCSNECREKNDRQINHSRNTILKLKNNYFLNKKTLNTLTGVKTSQAQNSIGQDILL